MDVTEPQIFLLLVLSAPALAALREFHFINLLKTWTDAQSYCREKFSDLATIETAEESEIVRQMLVDSGHSRAWIGLYDDLKSWRWSLDNSSLYERDLGSWFSFAADNAGSRQHCVELHRHRLQDGNCESRWHFLCYDEPSNSYILVEEGMTWWLAQSYCRQTYTDLASTRNQQEWNTIMGMLNFYGVYWVGLSRESWQWSDQSASSLRLWSGSEPHGHSEACAGVIGAGWFDITCERKMAFICSAPQWKVLKVTLKTDGLVNLKDLLVQEAVLKQMEKHLQDQGVHRRFSLRWRKQPHGDVFNHTQP